MRKYHRNISILIGNGPNLLSQDDCSWNQILEKLAEFVGDKELTNHSTGTPFPLLYEKLAVQYIRMGKQEKELKLFVSKLMNEMVPNGIHRRIVNSGIKHILTTNYDYNFELTAENIKQPANLIEENRYNLYRRNKLNHSNIWHIHGEISKPRTITLGYDHYVGYLSKIKEYLIWERRGKNKSKYSNEHSIYLQGESQFDDIEKLIYSWVDVFLRDDIHILGLGLDYSEIDLWWLLILKERQRLKSSTIFHSPIIGKTIFYNIYNDSITKIILEKIDILKSIGVQIVNILNDRGYERAYHSAITQILGG
jgi:hypothetical protein